MNSNFKHKCNLKKNTPVVTDTVNGEIFCEKCGVIFGDRMIDTSGEAGFHSLEDYLSTKRTGPVSKLSNSHFANSSLIAKRNFDASGNRISIKNRVQFSRLRAWDSRVKNNSKERNLVKAFIVLDSLTKKLALPEIAKEQAAAIYRMASENNLIRGNSTTTMISASTYASCRQLEIPRSLDEFSHSANIPKRRLSRTYRNLVRKLELNVGFSEADFVPKVASLVSADEKTKRISCKIINDLKRKKLHVGKNPVGLAAGAVYLSAIGSGKNISMSQISKKTKISTVTIRNIVKLLKPIAANYIETIAVRS